MGCNLLIAESRGLTLESRQQVSLWMRMLNTSRNLINWLYTAIAHESWIDYMNHPSEGLTGAVRWAKSVDLPLNQIADG